MKALEKTAKIAIQMIPILLMIALIPFVQNDYLLTGLDILIVSVSFLIKYESLISKEIISSSEEILIFEI